MTEKQNLSTATIQQHFGWSDSSQEVVLIPEKIASFVGASQFFNRKSLFSDPIAAIDSLSSKEESTCKSFILANTLLKYSNELNIRKIISKLMKMSLNGKRTIIIEEISNKNYSALERALKSLGLDRIVDREITGGTCCIRINEKTNIKNSSFVCEYIQAGSNLLNTNEVISIIQDSIQKKHGLSLIRLGDGEARFLGYKEYFGDSDIKIISNIVWGSDIPKYLVHKIQAELTMAVLNSDIIGALPRTTITDDTRSIIMQSTLPLVLSLRAERKFSGFVNPNNIHYSLGKSKDFLSTICSAEKIVLITSNKSLKEILSRCLKISEKISAIILPGEYVTDKSQVTIEERFRIFNNIEHLIKSAAKPGAIFLVGAGIIGKFWCSLIKEEGAVAIDMGSTLDAWCGIESRGGGFDSELKMALHNYLPEESIKITETQSITSMDRRIPAES